MTGRREVFLGRIRDQDRTRYAVEQDDGKWELTEPRHPMVGIYDGLPAAIWNHGDGGPPHAGFWGTTGGGKSSLARMVARGLVRRPGNRAITFIDGEGAGEYTMFRRMPGVAAVIDVDPAGDKRRSADEPSSVEQAAQALLDHLEESTDRNEERKRVAQAWERYMVDPAHHQPPAYVPPAEVFLIIDGWASLRYCLNRYLPKAERFDAVEAAIFTGRNGRKTDLHLVLLDQVSYASRSKDDAGLPPELKKQLGLRVAAVGPLGITATEAGMIFDTQDVHPPKELGGCLMKVGAELVPFKVPLWRNATDPSADLTPDERRASFRQLGVAPVESVA